MTSYVYAIYSSGCVKIGVSTEPQKRAWKISADCPHPVKLLGYIEGNYELEHELHGKFSRFHKKGEWFSFQGEVMDWANSLPLPVVKEMTTLVSYLKANRGAQTKLADFLGLQPSTVSQWKSVPVEHLAEVEAFTGIPREELLPEAFRAAREDAA